MPDARPPSARDHFRALARRVVNLPATVENRDGTWPRTARIMDLGLGGACMELLEVVPPGTPVRLLIEAPHLWDPLALWRSTQRSHGCGWWTAARWSACASNIVPEPRSAR
jgi:hypothetical protein